MAVTNWFRWRCSRARVRRKALRLIKDNGELAFFRAHEFAWRAQGEGAEAQARFWEAVAREVSRRIQRNLILTRIMTPSRHPTKAQDEHAVPKVAPTAPAAGPVRSAQICPLPTRPRAPGKLRAPARRRRHPA